MQESLNRVQKKETKFENEETESFIEKKCHFKTVLILKRSEIFYWFQEKNDDSFSFAGFYSNIQGCSVV